MPPKKRLETKGEDDSMIVIDDYLLPRSMVQRLAKGVLPPNTIINKDALTAVLKSTTVFINFLASNANDHAVLGNHKTIKPEDVIEALEEMELGHFVPRVRAEHDRYVEAQNSKRNDYRRRLKVENTADDAPADGAANGEAPANGAGDDAGEPAAKKARLSDAVTRVAGPDETADEDEDSFHDAEEGLNDEPEDEEVEDEEVEEEGDDDEDDYVAGEDEQDDDEAEADDDHDLASKPGAGDTESEDDY